ncbi:MAG: nicotinate (nicotinamide) nucleotide adenylyltransferase [Oscillospiraceae bacterium]|nr:nicotinate (nicotinamide) nucleotide adenylyltransferase [Oscillospiraceae bacterium]
MAKIGIFGGSFNPPHEGHILAMEEFQTQLGLDYLLVIPAGDPPHKVLSANSPTDQQRLEMTRLAVGGLKNAEVLDLEIKRTGLSYTADTIEILRKQYPDDELFLLMGTDMFYSFGTWYQPERITKEATIAVAHRDADSPAKLQSCAKELEEKLGARIAFVENQYLPHSSTSVRAMIAFLCADPYLDPAVLEYIKANGLYYAGRNLKDLSFEELREVSLSLHKSKRTDHVRGCSDTAAALAEHYGESVEDARRAGILHDITKALNGTEQLQLAEKYAMILDNFEREHPKLLHAKTGAVIAKEIFGEKDAVCESIRWHTTGRDNMTLLEKIIYLADYIEPNRSMEGIEELRRQTWTDLDEAMMTGLGMTISYVRSRGAKVDPHSAAALGFFQERKQNP